MMRVSLRKYKNLTTFLDTCTSGLVTLILIGSLGAQFYVPMQKPITYPDPCTGNLFDMTHARPGTGFLHADRPAIMKGLDTMR